MAHFSNAYQRSKLFSPVASHVALLAILLVDRLLPKRKKFIEINASNVHKAYLSYGRLVLYL